MKGKRQLFKFTVNDCPEIFNTANAYSKIGKGIALRWKKVNKSGKILNFDKMELAVATVNLHFSIELYLKGLYLQSTGNYNDGHELLKLFDLLPLEMKDEIEKSFIKKGIKQDGGLPLIKTNSVFENKKQYDPYKENISLKEFLAAHNYGFVKWRYHFEVDTNGSIHTDFPLIFVFIHSLRSQILPVKKKFNIEIA